MVLFMHFLHVHNTFYSSKFSRCAGLSLLLMPDMFCRFFGINGFVRILVDIECDQFSPPFVYMQ